MSSKASNFGTVVAIGLIVIGICITAWELFKLAHNIFKVLPSSMPSFEKCTLTGIIILALGQLISTAAGIKRSWRGSLASQIHVSSRGMLVLLWLFCFAVTYPHCGGWTILAAVTFWGVFPVSIITCFFCSTWQIACLIIGVLIFMLLASGTVSRFRNDYIAYLYADEILK